MAALPWYLELGLAMPAAVALGLSSPDEGRMYFDPLEKRFLVSENGGAYVPLITAKGEGAALPYITVSSTTSIPDTFGTVLIDASGGPITLTIPDSVLDNDGDLLRLVITEGGNPVTVQTTSLQLIGGQTTQVITDPDTGFSVISKPNVPEWFIIQDSRSESIPSGTVEGQMLFWDNTAAMYMPTTSLLYDQATGDLLTDASFNIGGEATKSILPSYQVKGTWDINSAQSGQMSQVLVEPVININTNLTQDIRSFEMDLRVGGSQGTNRTIYGFKNFFLLQGAGVRSFDEIVAFDSFVDTSNFSPGQTVTIGGLYHTYIRSIPNRTNRNVLNAWGMRIGAINSVGDNEGSLWAEGDVLFSGDTYWGGLIPGGSIKSDSYGELAFSGTDGLFNIIDDDGNKLIQYGLLALNLHATTQANYKLRFRNSTGEPGGGSPRGTAQGGVITAEIDPLDGSAAFLGATLAAGEVNISGMRIQPLSYTFAGSTLLNGSVQTFRNLSGAVAAVRTNGQVASSGSTATVSSLYNSPRIDPNANPSWSGAPISIASNRCGFYQFNAAAMSTNSVVVGGAEFYAYTTLGDDVLGGGSLTINNMYGFYYRTPEPLGANVAMDNTYGMYIEDVIRGATLNYAIYTNAGKVRIGDRFVLANPTVPATAADAGDAGEIAWDSDFVYVCVAANTWKRAAIATF